MAVLLGDHRGEGTAKICMLAIGIGYLFPISAIWAAFDYWKVLFPDSNIEFIVTVVYQIGSVGTVACLSLTETFSLRRRIVGGFLGQFLCLAAILSFRWLQLAPTVLYQLLLGLVLVCSVATGYLDSALLSLCSQYSSNMQQYLQIGIGFGTLVSVIYRDATKLLMSNDIADATCAYFSIALVTVILCLVCYRLLMSLPISRHVRASSGQLDEKLLDNSSIESPLPYACGFSPGGCRDSQESPQLDLNCEAGSSFKSVIQLVWRNQLVILANFTLTTFCYPGLITAIPCRQMLWLKSGHWFQTILLTVFTIFDICARFVTHIRCGLHHGNIQWTAVLRSALLPLMIFCAISDSSSDLLAMAVVATFGFLNGYCASLCLIVINEIPTLSPEQRKTCGRISACFVNSGRGRSTTPNV
ncbi:ENT7 [Symbiodinium natans]|uniref:ENT7 protein n=1 Tax=Symbiodinium natans TaxID=878477 RepID=A0A812JIW1_9DINO|nr:ENT7 [Symbiodinium natans]